MNLNQLKMKKSILISAAALLALSFTFEQATWSLDKTHSHLGFTINHLGIADINGSFNSVETKITSSKEDFSDAVVELSADAGSINTGNEQRDAHLKSADFLDAEKHPRLTFKSTSFTKGKGNHYIVKGYFTMHGITKPVELDAVHNGTTVHPMNKKSIAGFKVSGTIKRSDFGVATSMTAPFLSDEIKLLADLEFSKE
jgi:polyisoprenoid-binding protein YceI